jgi:uncharacterized protein YdiU (UPF0061 family)
LFEAEYGAVLRAKIGLSREEDGDFELAADLLRRLAANRVDYTRFFRGLCASAADSGADAALAAQFAEPAAFHGWMQAWRQRLERDALAPGSRASAMRRANPAFIPRNHRIEQAIAAAVDGGDFTLFERLGEVLERPYEDQPEFADLAEPPRPEERVRATFCGT